MKVAYQTPIQIPDNHTQTQMADQQRQAAAAAIDNLLGSVRKAVTQEEIPRRRWSVKNGAGVGKDGSADSNKSNKNGRQTPKLRKRRRRADSWRVRQSSGRTPTFMPLRPSWLPTPH
jgi:hypothetical protein